MQRNEQNVAMGQQRSSMMPQAIFGAKPFGGHDG
jgi:hypothetical protein